MAVVTNNFSCKIHNQNRKVQQFKDVETWAAYSVTNGICRKLVCWIVNILRLYVAIRAKRFARTSEHWPQPSRVFSLLTLTARPRMQLRLGPAKTVGIKGEVAVKLSDSEGFLVGGNCFGTGTKEMSRKKGDSMLLGVGLSQIDGIQGSALRAHPHHYVPQQILT